ncbi:MAG: mycothiol synthase [Acidimicrobiaceae bacterium]|nr:mycothiol synthase [Acidimicrobiaceae bacterium]
MPKIDVPGRPGDPGRGSLDTDTSGWALEVDGAASEGLLTRALGEVASRGGGTFTWWVNRPTAADESLAAAMGLTPGRVLYEMRRPLPVDEEHRRAAEPLTTRPFRPGEDEEAWLAVNNRAFAWHPEQGGWTRETIEAREAEDWFDPEGFLLHETDGTVDGFCWTKVHPAADPDPVLGEIYVIAADPSSAGGGFGRRLTLAGLDYLAGLGIETGILYVDATNERAVKLYVDLGFIVHHLHQGFVTTVGPATTEPTKDTEPATTARDG